MKTIGFLTLRAQPFHLGHHSIISQALQKCDRLVLLIGSANRSISYRNPWSYQQRLDVFKSLYTSELAVGELAAYPVNDYQYSDMQWLSDVLDIVNIERADARNNVRTIMFGHRKAGNDYLDLFNGEIEFVHLDSGIEICASDIRQKMFDHELLPAAAQADKAYFIKEKERFANYPYPETLNFNCSDAIVECNGHIALIQRKFAPGMGAWAMPGGFKNQRETFLDCAVRELLEEVNIRVPEKVLRGSLVSSKMFDSPFRGQGLPRNTMAFHFKIGPNADDTMPEIRPADDAIHCEWMPINAVMNDISMHDDHQAIISTLLNVMPKPAHLNPRYL